MKTGSDVIVIGGGPCGSFTALNLARKGVSVTVFEEHRQVGVPNHCPGHISINGLRRLGLYSLPERIVQNVFRGANFYGPNVNKFSVRFKRPVTCVVDRVLLERHVAEMAKKAGAEYSLDSRVESLIIEDGCVRGVTAKQQGEAERKFPARIVVDAEGISSRILRQTGLRALNQSMLVTAVEAEVEDVKDVEPDIVEVFLGSHYAPGFYAWLIPKRDNTAKIGLGTNTGNPRVFLQRLMSQHPAASKKLRSAKISRIAFHPITLGGPIPAPYSSGFLAVGDVASHVKPTTGGGVVLGSMCARVAAETACDALQKGDLSSEFLSVYQRRCRELLGFDMRAMLRIRRMLNELSDSEIDKAFGFFEKIGLDKSLQGVRELDFQGRSLLSVLKSPRTFAALAYFLWLYLSANP